MPPRILVADDSVTIQKVVELTFSKENVTLLQARSGEDAIRKAKEERPDLILLDLVMPDKNGYEVCAALRAEPMLKAVPIILLTGTFEAFDRERAVHVGANDFVTKPFESQQLISKVRQQLFNRTVDAGPSTVSAVPPKPAAQAAARPVPAPPVGPAAMTPPGVKPAEGHVAPPSEHPASPPVPPQMAAAPPIPAAALGMLEVPAPAPTSSLPSVAPAPGKQASAAAGPMELRLEDLAHLDARAPTTVPEPLSLDDLLGPVEPASVQVPSAALEGLAPATPPVAPTPSAAPPIAPGPLSEALVLEDLLPAPPIAPGPIAGMAQAPVEPAAEAQVFDLTAEMGGPALPMIEVGKGEPPALSVEDLIGAKEVTPTPEPGPAPLVPEGMRLEEAIPRPATVVPGFDLTAEMGGPALPMIEVGKGEPPALSVEDLVSEAGPAPLEPPQLTLPELELPSSGLETAGTTPPAPGEAEFAMEPVFEEAAPGPEIGVVPLPGLETLTPPSLEGERPPLETPAESTGAEIGAAEISEPLPGLETDALLAAAVSEPASAPAPVPPAAPAAPLGVGSEEMASMRDAVTERVARVLARDLSEKLVERIERIVWEVVPEMAELMIAKEIERIRSLADEKNIS